MRQIVQNLRSGGVEVRSVPAPNCGRMEILVETRASLISAGTERMVMEFAGKSMVGKAKERPDLVKKVLAKVQRDGLLDTMASVFARLDEPLPLGYSAAGRVLAVGAGVGHEFTVGDRVAIAGAGQANHAEVNAVPRNLAVKLPDNVPYEYGCYATLAAIALHGVRNANVVLGDRVLVVGLGLVGQLAVQLAAAAGARVAGMDLSKERCGLAVSGGAAWTAVPAEMEAGWQHFTDGRGFDAILICAATESDGPIEQAATMARDRASVVLVGKVGTKFPYAAYMKKELQLKVSRSYGPGRYDPAFEGQGLSYPVGFVPWTERENLGEAVRLMSLGKLDVALLTSHTFAFDEALRGYDLVKRGGCLGVVLEYADNRVTGLPDDRITGLSGSKKSGDVGVSLLGVGGFARSVVLPALRGLGGWSLQGVVSKGGLSAAHVAEKYKAAWCGGDAARIFGDNHTNAVMVLTRHDAHAKQVLAALAAGKHVWVEKPLALSLADIGLIEKAAAKAGRVLMVGFNRRFSPALVPLKGKLDAVRGPKQVLVRVNAGRLEEGWQHSDEGGGRLLGEVCHFTDVCVWLLGEMPEKVEIVQGGGQDCYSVTLRFASGSLAQVFYSSEGDASLPKERVEVLGGGGMGIMDNYSRTLWSQHGRKHVLYKKPWWKGQEKGHAPALAAWLRACSAGQQQGLPSVAELCESSRIVFKR